eukprot:4547810-Pyramimonas_sp.AAC.1
MNAGTVTTCTIISVKGRKEGHMGGKGEAMDGWIWGRTTESEKRRASKCTCGGAPPRRKTT